MLVEKENVEKKEIKFKKRKKSPFTLFMFMGSYFKIVVISILSIMFIFADGQFLIDENNSKNGDISEFVNKRLFTEKIVHGSLIQKDNTIREMDMYTEPRIFSDEVNITKRDIAKDIKKFGNPQGLLNYLYKTNAFEQYNDYPRDKTTSGKEKYYDLIHLRAYEFGLSPNYIASIMGMESSGKALAGSDKQCFGLFQINKSEWSKFNGSTYVKMDGTVGTITLNGSGYSGYSRDITVKGNPWDVEANSYVGVSILKDSLEVYENIWIVYGVHNGGKGFANLMKKYLGENTENMTLHQIISIIEGYCEPLPNGWNGETNKALKILAQIYNKNKE